MKIKHLSLIILIAAAFASCSKDSVKPNSINTVKIATVPAVSYAVEGKWQQTELEVYMLDPTGKKMYDTTYLQPFTVNDYIQFLNDGTCALSVSHYFYLNEPGTATTPSAISPLISNFNYALTNASFVLTSQSQAVGPGGGTSADTVYTPDKNTVLLHGVATGNGASRNLFISNSYYTRVGSNSQQ